MSSDLTTAVREILADHAGLDADAATIAADADLYDAGMTSHASVNVMLAIEDELDVEFPDELLQRSTFETVDSIVAAVSGLKEE